MAAWEPMSAADDDAEALIPGGAKVASPGAASARWKKASVAAAAAALGAVALLGRGSGPQLELVDSGSVVGLQAYADPKWGCGLLGALPGISADGSATPEMKTFIDALKSSSSMNKVSYWNWNLAPESTEDGAQHLSADFLFMPEMWGAGVVNPQYVREAGTTGWLDSNGQPSKAEMADIFLGSNEPDITGSCMGNMFGTCTKSCSDASVAAGDCPEAFLDITHAPGHANAKGECNCWQTSHATGVGFWQFAGCQSHQPLPGLFKDGDQGCIGSVMDSWKKTAAIAYGKGYKYLTTPLVAEDISYTESFIKLACQCTAPGQCACTDASCGCPVYVGFHFYAYDCRPESAGGYAGFQKRLDEVTDIMERYPFVKGAIVNEVGMLNCAPHSENPICIPGTGKYPAVPANDNACPVTKDLPNGLASFIDKLFDMVIAQKTSAGKAVVAGFSWFNENMAGGTYNLQLFNKDGSVNDVGKSYMDNCKRWGKSA